MATEKSAEDLSSADLVYYAELAEQAERYDDMVLYMRTVAKREKRLEVRERNLLSVAYKNVVGARRAAWRVLSSLEQVPDRPDEEQTELTTYRKQVEDELWKLCNAIITTLEKDLIPSAETVEAKVFYHKMAGDYQRYLAEFLGSKGARGREATKAARGMYEKAVQHARDEDLPKTNPILLGLILNFSVFQYEILGQPQKACDLAKSGFDAAVEELDTLEEASYKDATLIMQLLRDNLTLWTSDVAS